MFARLCALCGDTADHHLRFQLLKSLHMCLRQASRDRAQFEAKQDAVMRIIWNSLEDPCTGISKQIKVLFEFLLERRPRADGEDGAGAAAVAASDQFWNELASRFLALDWRRRGASARMRRAPVLYAPVLYAPILYASNNTAPTRLLRHMLLYQASNVAGRARLLPTRL